MQFLADIVKKMNQENLITKKDLYTLSEKEIINKIEKCQDKNISNCFKQFKNTSKINESNTPVPNKYCVSVKSKRRYIVPLVRISSPLSPDVSISSNCYERITNISNLAKQKVDEYLRFEPKPYAYFDFNL